MKWSMCFAGRSSGIPVQPGEHSQAIVRTDLGITKEINLYPL